jgi:hypothetical protein
MPSPRTTPRLGSCTVAASASGARKGTASPAAMGASLAPLARGSTAPSPTNATRPMAGSWSRRYSVSSTHSTCSCSWRRSCCAYSRPEWTYLRVCICVWGWGGVRWGYQQLSQAACGCTTSRRLRGVQSPSPGTASPQQQVAAALACPLLCASLTEAGSAAGWKTPTGPAPCGRGQATPLGRAGGGRGGGRVQPVSHHFRSAVRPGSSLRLVLPRCQPGPPAMDGCYASHP